MRVERDIRKAEILKHCFDCFCEYGISETNAKKLAAACGVSAGNLYNYFESKDQIIIEATAYCMSRVEDSFMEKAPVSYDDIPRFIREVPEWTLEEHGKQFRFMYQVYTSPKYRESGEDFFIGQTRRYETYSKMLAPRLGIPCEVLEPLIYTFVRAVVHYALFEEKEYLDKQMNLLMQIVDLLYHKAHSGSENQ